MPADRILVFKGHDDRCAGCSCEQIVSVLSSSFPACTVGMFTPGQDTVSEGPAMLIVPCHNLLSAAASFQEQSSTLSSLRAAKARVVQQFERSYLIDVLTASDGNISLAARTAGKERRSFQRLLRKYNIAIEQFKQPVRKENHQALRNSA